MMMMLLLQALVRSKYCQSIDSDSLIAASDNVVIIRARGRVSQSSVTVDSTALTAFGLWSDFRFLMIVLTSQLSNNDHRYRHCCCAVTFD